MNSVARRLSKAHTILGLVLLVPLLIATLTGILLGWYDQLRYASEPYGLSSPSDKRLAPDDLVKVLEKEYPNERAEILFLAVDPSRAVRAKLGTSPPMTVFLHPGTGRVLGTRTSAQRDWVDVLYDLHPGKTFGLAGQITMAVTATGVAALWTIGIVIWHRRGGSGKKPPVLSWRTVPFHRWAGFWLGPLFILLAGLGALLNFAGPLIATFDPPPTVAPGGPLPDKVGLASLVELHAKRYPHAAVERIIFPKRDGEVVQVRYADGGWMFLDGSRGTVINVKGPIAHWTRSLYPLHSGRLVGVAGPWIVASVGVLLLCSVFTGVRFSWRLRGKRTSNG